MLNKISNNFALFRDDLFPFLGGGNKARKMMALHKTIKKQYNAIVTTGGIQSNHCRAVAVYCNKYNLNCTLVIHGDMDRFIMESGNAKIIRSTNAKLIFCNPHEISEFMDKAMDNYRENGNNPFYLNGGGHTLEGGKAYIDIIEELIKTDYIPDYIFIASGTGSTQAGIIAGISKFELNTKVIGISVGRNKKRAEEVVKQFYNNLCEKYNIHKREKNILVNDSFLCGGYEKYNSSIENIVNKSIVDYGIILDHTYTGKAFYGMKQLIDEQAIEGKILFWNTGGIYNYLAK